MGRGNLRRIVVDDEVFLWCLKRYHDVWCGTLVVYSPAHKHGRLEVWYTEAAYFAWNRYEVVVIDQLDPTRGLNIHEPETTARVIRYARKHLGWHPDNTKTPYVIEDGIEILKQVGYVAVPRKSHEFPSSTPESESD